MNVILASGLLQVELAEGLSLIVPLEWNPRLMHRTGAELQNWQLLGDGYAIEWLDWDEHISVVGLIAGRRSGESDKSLNRWLAGRTPRP